MKKYEDPFGLQKKTNTNLEFFSLELGDITWNYKLQSKITDPWSEKGNKGHVFLQGINIRSWK